MAVMFIGIPGGPEMVVILLLAVLLFGASKLPALARSSGQAMGEFKKGREEVERELREARGAAADAADERDDDEREATAA